MKRTSDGYFIPETDDELAEAIENNTGIDADKFKNKTHEQQNEMIKKIIKAPKGYSKNALKLDNYLDNVQDFYHLQPFFFDKTQMFWLWNKEQFKYEITDDTSMLNLIDDELSFGGQTVTSKIKNNYLEAFRRIGRKHIPKEPPKTWIQFKNKIVDLKTNEIKTATPDYFITNPIPWTLSEDENTPTIDKLFNDWQGDNKEILYEVIAYCLIPDYPIHIIIANIGTGRNGKSQYTKIIEKFIGRENTTSAELDSLIKERFESAKLHKKLVCLMGETNFGMMSQTSLLKKLCGGDLISYEYKNKMPFTDVNYAKIIINTNSLPATGDTTDGFFRRWLIINWQNNFDECGKNIYEQIPDAEYGCLARKCLNKLRSLLARGHFVSQGSIDDRKQKYIMASNPITLFLHERCEQADSYYVKAKDLYHAYINYLQEKKRRIIKRKEFNQILAEEGYQAEHCEKKVEIDGDVSYQKSYWVEGLRLRVFSAQFAHSALDSTLALHVWETKVESKAEKAEKAENSTSLEPLGFEMASLMIQERPAQEIETDTLISYGVSENDINKWKKEGLIFEIRPGYLKLL